MYVRKALPLLMRTYALYSYFHRTAISLLFTLQGMKSIRVKLMRQMKEESERFRALKAQKEKEINTLKQQVSGLIA